MFGKKRITCATAGIIFYDIVLSCTLKFEEEYLAELMKELELKTEDYNLNIIRSVVVNIALWAVFKELENDRPEILRSAYSNYIQSCAYENRDLAAQAFDQVRTLYNEAWNEETPSQQWVLGSHMVGQLFYNGEPQLDLFGAFSVIMFVFSIMKWVREVRNEMRLID